MSSHKKAINKSKITNTQFRDNIFSLIPIFLIIVIIPLIIYIKAVNLSDIELKYTGLPKEHFDIFSYYKMVYLLVLTSIGLIIFFINKPKNIFDKQKNQFYIPMGIYLALVLISALASEYKAVAFWGFMDRYEGAFVLMAYIVIMYLAMNLFKEEKSIRIFFISLLASSFIMGILCTLQYLGINYFDTEFFKNLITPKSLNYMEGTLSTSMPPKTAFATLYNPDYVGSYMAMLIPIILVFFIWIKKIIYKMILFALLCLNIVGLIGSNSNAGIVAVLFSVFIVLIMFRQKFLKHKMATISVIILIVGGLAIVNFTTKGLVLNEIKKMYPSEYEKWVVETQKAFDKTYQGLLDIKLDSSRAKIVTEKGTLQIILEKGNLKTLDESNKEVKFHVENSLVSFDDKRFNIMKLNISPEQGLLEVLYNNASLIKILFTENGLISSSNRWMTYRDGKSIETFGFKGKEYWGSGRGYIWSRSIPLLKNTVLLGHGPDTYPIYFPQYDYLGKLKLLQNGAIFVDKPHNIYLQTGINTGILSLFALLALFGIYFISSIRIYIKEINTFYSAVGMACFAAFCGYAVTGLINDSVISVAPVFWAIFGLGIGINFILRDKLVRSIKNAGKDSTPIKGKS